MTELVRQGPAVTAPADDAYMCSVHVAAPLAYLAVSVGIPDFAPSSLLLPKAAPAGPLVVVGDQGNPQDNVQTHAGWPCTLDEVRERFVDPYQHSETRFGIFHHLTDLIGAGSLLVDCALFLVSGAFVADVDDPLDAYLGLIVLPRAIAQLDGPRSLLLHSVFNDITTGPDQWEVTTAIGCAYRVGHGRYVDALTSIARLRYAAGFPLGEPGGPGGYLQIPACEGGDEDDAEILDFLANAVATP